MYRPTKHKRKFNILTSAMHLPLSIWYI